jgi:hypothetical protein
LAARNLHHVRQLLGADLIGQVEQITTDLNQRTEQLTAWVDVELLRGIPACGGVITDSVIPGSDDHMDWLDNIRRSA